MEQRYQLDDFVAEGGMGAVYRGLDRESGKIVAIKQLKPEVVTPATLERFEREGDILRRLDHPNIVKLLATYSDGDNHYLVMEYVSGGSLRDLLRKEKFIPISRVLEIALELADALARTHHLKIIHRDLKPDNVLLSDDGTPRLTDFGMSRSELVASLPDSGILGGTLPYLPPEAFDGDTLDARSDLWAFGIMLFELLTGERPFDRNSLVGILKAIRQEPTPDLQALVPGIPIALEDTIYRLLEKDRLARLPNARLLGAELQAILEGIDARDYVGQRPKDVLQAINQSLGVIPTPSAAQSNLPAQSTPFVGRDDELQQVKEMLLTDSIREISIIASGGMGKTRFAIECAAAQIEEFTDGVYFVALAALTDPEQIVTTAASAIGLQTSGNQDPRERVLSYLRDKHILLIMDNFEHILDGAAFVSELLDAAPQLKVVATSRERLNIESETLFRLESLEVSEATTPEAAAEYSAVKLFLQSAKRVQPGFELTADVLPHVVQICREVAGLPLGIILAASWIDTLTPVEIVQEIARNIDFLATERRDVPTRQRSIRAVFDYSWQLLTSEEQAIFKQLSVFHGGFTREAAQAVTNASLRTLQALVNKSMLRRTPEGRFELHDLLQHYAAEQLANFPQEQRITRTHYSQYYMEFLILHEEAISVGPIIPREIQPELENIKAFVEISVSQVEIEILAMLYPTVPMTSAQLGLTDGIAFFRDLLEKIPSATSVVWAYIALQLGTMYLFASERKQANLLLIRCLSIFREYNAPRGLAATLKQAYIFEPDPTKAQTLMEESLSIFQELGEKRQCWSVLTNLCKSALEAGQLDNAQKWLDAIESGDYHIDHPHRKSNWLHQHSELERLRGNFLAAKADEEEAEKLYVHIQTKCWPLLIQAFELAKHGLFEQAELLCRDALVYAVKEGHLQLIYSSQIYLSILLSQQGRFIEAREWALNTLATSQEISDGNNISNSLNNLGHIAVALDEDTEAIGYYREAFQLASTRKDLQSILLEVILGFATLLGKHAAVADKIHAVELMSFVQSSPHNLEGLYMFGDMHWERLQTELPSEVFTVAVECGKTFDYDDVIAEFAEQP